jgi:hypothetical protein
MVSRLREVLHHRPTATQTYMTAIKWDEADLDGKHTTNCYVPEKIFEDGDDREL